MQNRTRGRARRVVELGNGTLLKSAARVLKKWPSFARLPRRGVWANLAIGGIDAATHRNRGLQR